MICWVVAGCERPNSARSATSCSAPAPSFSSTLRSAPPDFRPAPLRFSLSLLLTYHSWVPPDIASIPRWKWRGAGDVFFKFNVKITRSYYTVRTSDVYSNIGNGIYVILCWYSGRNAHKLLHSTALFWSAKLPNRTKPERSHLVIWRTWDTYILHVWAVQENNNNLQIYSSHMIMEWPCVLGV